MVYLIWQFGSRGPERTAVLEAYIVGSYAAALEVGYQYWSGQILTERLAVPGMDPNQTGVGLATGIPIALLLALRGKWRLVNYAYILVASTAIILLASRGAFLALAASGLVAATLLHRQGIKAVIALAVLGAIVYLGLSALPDLLWARFQSVGLEWQHSGIVNDRQAIWAAGWSAFLESPVFGYGTGSFRAAVDLGGRVLVAHNTFLSVLVETGVIGAVWFLAWLFSLTKHVFATPDRTERTLLLAVFTCWLVGSLSLTLDYWKVSWFLFAVLASAPARGFQMPVSLPEQRPAMPHWRHPRVEEDPSPA
jgi:O-antigen ligase